MTVRFLAGLGIMLLLYMIISFLFLKFIMDSEVVRNALISSGSLSTLFVLITYFSSVLVARRAGANFNRVFLLTLTLRFIVMLGIMLVFLTMLKIDHFTFIVSLFILYFAFQLWEIYMLNLYMKQE